MALSKVRESWRLKPSLPSRVDRKICVCSSCSERNKTSASHLLWVCCGCQKRKFKTPLWNQTQTLWRLVPAAVRGEDAEKKQAQSPVWVIYAGPLSVPLCPIADIRVFAENTVDFGTTLKALYRWQHRWRAWTLCPKHFWMEKKDVNWNKRFNTPLLSHKTHINIMRGCSVTAHCCF